MTDLERYMKLNSSFKNELIFHLGSDAGFYSELNNMVLAIAYCLKNRIRFSLYSADANFKYKYGWKDYFIPFCDEHTSKFHQRYNTRYSDPFFFTHGFERLRILCYRLRHKHTYLTSDVFYKFRTTEFQRESFSVPELAVDGDLKHISRRIISTIYQFNKDVNSEIQDTLKSLNLPSRYIGLHIRGGDKFVEHELEACTAYINKAERLSSLRIAYVLTDDYAVVKTLRRDYPNWTFYTLTAPSESGYFHQQFVKCDVQERRRDLIKLFSSIEILRKADVFIGTFSSNPGMFLGMCMDNAYGVDFDEWTIW